MNLLKRLCFWIDTVNEWIGKGVAWVTLGLVLVVFIDVVMRYLFNTSFVFTQELEWHLFAFIFLIGAGYTLLHDGHVRVDIIYQRLGYKGRAWTNLIGVIFFLLPAFLLLGILFIIPGLLWRDHLIRAAFHIVTLSKEPSP